MKQHYLLGEVSKVLGRQPHHVTHVLTTGKVPEPEQRLANKRLFTQGDVLALSKHFGVAPKWSALDSASAIAEPDSPQRLTLRPPFDVHNISGTGHEVRDNNGDVFAWTSDRSKALVVAGLLEAAARG
jgi:hypothetical protein